jgi:hypothetical protein
MTITEADLKRMRQLSKGHDSFTVHFNHDTKELVLLVNGVERNRIKLIDPTIKFELCLSTIKDLFISWRKPPN